MIANLQKLKLLGRYSKTFGGKETDIYFHESIPYGIIGNTRNAAEEGFFYWVNVVLPEDDKYIVLTFKVMGGDAYGDRIYGTAFYFRYEESDSYNNRSLRPDSMPKKFKPYELAAAELIRTHKESTYWPFKAKSAVEDGFIGLPNEQRWACLEEQRSMALEESVHQEFMMVSNYQDKMDATVSDELIETMERLSRTHGISRGMHQYLAYSITTLKENKEATK